MTDMKTDLLRTLVEAYERHTERFTKVAELRRSEGESIEIEPLMRTETGDVRRDGVLNLPTRCDFGIQFAGMMQEKNLATRHPEALIQGYYDIAGMNRIWVSPFAWNALDIQFRLESDWPDFKPLRRWYLEWSLASRGHEKPFTKNVLHKLSGPTPSAAGWLLTLDLGSAPPEAVLDLLDALSAIGSKNVTFGACLSVDAE